MHFKKDSLKPLTFLYCLFWIILFLSLLFIYYYASKTLKLTNPDTFHEGSEEIVHFFEDNWDENFLAAENRAIDYGLDYRIYEIQINGQRKGESEYWQSDVLAFSQRLH